MVKIKIALQRHGTEIELSSSTHIQVGNYVVVHAPKVHETFGKFMTGQVLEVP
jgi:hypothetical protein